MASEIDDLERTVVVPPAPRRKRKRRLPGASHCIRGHPLTPDNLNKSGYCKLCNALRLKRWKRENPDSYRASYEKYNKARVFSGRTQTRQRMAEQVALFLENQGESQKAAIVRALCSRKWIKPMEE